MNKYVKLLGIVAVIAVAALAAGAGAAGAFANPPAPTQVPGGFGPGLMGGYGSGMIGGGYGRGMMDGGGIMAQYRDIVHAKVAEALGMTLDEFNAALAAGKTPFSLAQEKGVDFAKVQEAMQAGMAEALKQAVKDGQLTQAQADQMLAHHAQMQAWHANGAHPHGHIGGGFNGNCPHGPAVSPTPAP